MTIVNNMLKTSKYILLFVIFIFITTKSLFCQIGKTIKQVLEEENGQVSTKTTESKYILTFKNTFKDEYGNEFESIKEIYFASNSEKVICKSWSLEEPAERRDLLVETLNKTCTKTSTDNWKDENNKLMYVIFDSNFNNGNNIFSLMCFSIDPDILDIPDGNFNIIREKVNQITICNLIKLNMENIESDIGKSKKEILAKYGNSNIWKRLIENSKENEISYFSCINIDCNNEKHFSFYERELIPFKKYLFNSNGFCEYIIFQITHAKKQVDYFNQSYNYTNCLEGWKLKDYFSDGDDNKITTISIKNKFTAFLRIYKEVDYLSDIMSDLVIGLSK